MCSSKRSVVPQSTASAGFALRVVAFLVAVHFGAHVRAQQQIAATDAAAPERWSQSHTSLLHGLFDSIANPHAESADKCARDVGIIVDGVRNGETWALKILDTGPHVPSAFVYGDNFWFTATALCQRANDPLPMTMSSFVPRRMRANLLSDASPIRMQHRMVYANYSSDMQVDISFPVAPVVHIGLCMPATCSDADVSRYTQSYLSRRNGNALPFLASFDLNMTVVAVKSVYANENRMLRTTSFYLVMSIIGFSTIVVLANIFQRPKFDKHSFGHNKSRKSSDDQLPAVSKTESNNNCNTDRTIVQRIGDCFNIGVNVGELFVHSHPEKDVAALAGIRSTVCLWILAFHVNYHSAFAMSNLTELMMKMEWFVNQPMFQAFMYVDVFFVISATLMVYNFLRNEAKRSTIKQNNVAQNAVLFVRTVIHRYVRLTPVLIVTMVFSDVIYNFLDEFSPFYMNPKTDFYCKETWWHNLLYIQNFIKLTDMCDSWTWYLACDMQFYIVGLVVLFVYAKRPSSAKWLYVVGTVSLVCISFYSNFVHHISFETNMMLANLDIIYATPWVRMNPFMGGALTGWILYKKRAEKVAPRRRWVHAYWSAALVVFLVSLFFTYARDVSPVYCAVVFSLGKFAFGLFIGSVVLMCHWGCGGSLKNIWQMSVFQHLSKLSYCIYMISPLVITLIHGAKNVGTHFDEMQSLVSIIATVVLSYLAAVLLAVFYELPFQKLSDEFVLKRTKRIAAK